ncbi:hypothetical protein D0T84_10655 [Dysgonomonas sp. 521]|uniref:hypothetical protein n=1 Tax=Dysgonomonas sp. 521 TaxID=2302932 RepID=UPI0013D72567|nr:hypothetical protein [Dysgonomonas sp. 521]NDV95374.1 hypothetical protein [Dysgonomonas sp. 521]
MGKGKSLGSILNEIPAKEQEIDRGKNEAISYAKRRWKDTQELIDNIQGITNEFENNLLSSLVFEGLIFRAGAPSLQYSFLENDWTNTKRLTPRYENKKIYIDNPQRITHEVITIDGKKPYWNVTAFESDNLKADTPYFLYIEASKTLVPDTTGRMIGEARFAISDKKIKLEDKEGYYTFWVAFINSENEGQERSIRSMYGYTELLPGQITADTLISSDGNSYLDFLSNQFKFGNKDSGLDWNVSKDKQLSIRNADFEIKNVNKEVVSKIDGKSGAAAFSKGLVKFETDGSGQIGGWSINQGNLISQSINLESKKYELELSADAGKIFVRNKDSVLATFGIHQSWANRRSTAVIFYGSENKPKVNISASGIRMAEYAEGAVITHNSCALDITKEGLIYEKNDSNGYLENEFRIQMDGSLTNFNVGNLPQYNDANGLVPGKVYRDKNNFLKVAP